MVSNKDRLYVALYARGGQPKMPGGEDKFHWAFIVGPKRETANAKGMRYDVKDNALNREWRFEEKQILLTLTAAILVRVVVGKVLDGERLAKILAEVPTKSDDDAYNCVIWAKIALERIAADGQAVGTSILSWDDVRASALGYCQGKVDSGRFGPNAPKGLVVPPTFDLLEEKELAP